MSTLPQQKLLRSKKTEEWKHNTIDFYERLARVTSTGNRSGNSRKLVNYELFNGRFDKADLEYVINPLGLKDAEFPASLQHYDIISPSLMLLMGEETKRVDTQLVISEGPDDLDRKRSNVTEKVMQALIDEVKVELGQLDPKKTRTPEEVLKYEKYTTSDLIESQANKLLQVLKKHLDLKNVFKRGWKDALIVGEEIYWTGISNGEPIVRRVNPVDIDVVMPADSEFVDDAIAVVEARLLPISSILDEFGELLKPSQIDKLEELVNNFGGKNLTNGTFNLTEGGGVQFSAIGATTGTSNARNLDSSVRVVRVEWQSMCKIGILAYVDPETGEPQETEVDETFDLKAFKETIDPDALLDWFWINEPWEGIKIGQDIYLDIKAKQNQRRRLDNPYYSRLGYTGMLYNATNSVGVSLIDRMKPYQYLYNILMYRLELAFASDMGKVFLMDLAQIPRSEGMDIEKWMYYLKTMKIGFINSFEESQKGSRIGQVAQFNQFQAVDLTLSNTIQQYISSLEYIKSQVGFLSGISPQRLSSVRSNELVGNVERSIEQSSYITEYWFDMHSEVKRRTYTALIECAKIAYREGLRKQYVLDDMGIELLEIDGMAFENSEFSVYVSSDQKDYQIREQIKGLFQTALSADKASLSDIIEVLQNTSIKDLQHKLQNNEEKRIQQGQQAQQAQQEQQAKAAEMQNQVMEKQIMLEERKLDLEEFKIIQDNQTKIHVAEIGTYFQMPDMDTNNNGIPDPMEIANLALEQSRLGQEGLHKGREQSLKEGIEKMKITTLKQIEDRKLKMKEKELKSKEKVEKLKADSQIKVARLNRDNKK